MFIGLDLGIFGFKGVVIDNSQCLIVEVNVFLIVLCFVDGWLEQDFVDWIVVVEVVMVVLGQVCDVLGVWVIGLLGQMYGVILIGVDDQVLCFCILWNDMWLVYEVVVMDVDLKFCDLMGNIVFLGFIVFKLFWVKNNEFDIFERVFKVLLFKDYLCFWLLGDYVVEMFDVVGIFWFDIGVWSWFEDLLVVIDLGFEYMLCFVEGFEVLGILWVELVSKWGLFVGVVIVGGGGDNVVSVVGMGVVWVGDVFVSFGILGVFFVVSDVYQLDVVMVVYIFCYVLLNMWYQMGVIFVVVDVFNWYVKVIGKLVVELVGGLGVLQVLCDMLFLFYLGGECILYNDVNICGVFLLLDYGDDQVVMICVVFEGVIFVFCDSFDVL